MASLRTASEAFYRKWKPRLTPDLRHSQHEYKDKLDRYILPGSRWLDAGCGHGVFPEFVKGRGAWLVDRCAFAAGVDCYCPNLRENRIIPHRVAGDMSDFPFRDASFDVVTANMVVEHVSDADLIGRSVNRILKPGGVFIFHTPNLLNYQTLFSATMPQPVKNRLIRFLEKREEKDVFPTRYRLNTSRTVSRMARRNGFAVEEISLVNSIPETFSFGPAVLAIDMLLIRLSESRLFRSWRTNLVAVLRKTADAGAHHAPRPADKPTSAAVR